jgi:hypothetical protein
VKEVKEFRDFLTEVVFNFVRQMSYNTHKDESLILDDNRIERITTKTLFGKNKTYDVLFKVTRLSVFDDELKLKQTYTQLLDVKPQTFHVEKIFCLEEDETPYQNVIDCMNYLETFTNPYDKFNGVCHMRREIARSLDKYWENRPKPTKDKIRVTAENILPLFSYCMGASRNEKMRAHQVFIEEFIEEDMIKFGEEGYSFTTFVATVDFLSMYNDVSPRKSKLKK